MDFPEDKDKSSISLINWKIFSYERSIFLIIYSEVLGLISICLSENDLVIITLNSSSVGSSIPKVIKLSILDCKSLNLNSKSFKGKLELMTTNISNCFDWLSIE